MLLTAEELVQITGYRRPRDQVAWMRDRYGIPAYVNAAGEPVVLKAHLLAASRPQQIKVVRQVRQVT